MIYLIYIYNSVAPLKLLNDFHRKVIYLCKIYDSPPGIVGMIISIKNMGPFAQTNMSNAISLNSDEQQSHTHHMHVLPPKVKVWISAFVLFQNVDIIFFMFTKFSIVKSVTSSLVHGPDKNLVPPRGTKAHMFFLIGLCM